MNQYGDEEMAAHLYSVQTPTRRRDQARCAPK